MADGVSIDEVVSAVSADVQSLADLRDGHYVRVGVKQIHFHDLPSRFFLPGVSEPQRKAPL